jgi:hypothetical protein
MAVSSPKFLQQITAKRENATEFHALLTLEFVPLNLAFSYRVSPKIHMECPITTVLRPIGSATLIVISDHIRFILFFDRIDFAHCERL